MINVLHQDCRSPLHVEYGSIPQQQNLMVQVFSLWNHKSQSDLQHLAFWLQQPGVVNRQEVPPSLFMILRHPPVCCVHWRLLAIKVEGGFLPCSVEIQNCRHEESLGHNLNMNLCSTSSRTSFGWSRQGLLFANYFNYVACEFKTRGTTSKNFMHCWKSYLVIRYFLDRCRLTPRRSLCKSKW